MEGKGVALIVEDETFVRLDITDIVESSGYETCEAASADEAMEILRKRPDIRIVLTDINMPGRFDGADLALYVRTNFPEKAVGVVSANTATAKLPDSIPVLRKPFSVEEIVELLSKLRGELLPDPARAEFLPRLV